MIANRMFHLDVADIDSFTWLQAPKITQSYDI